MVGLLQTEPCGFTHLLVAVDKFTKWIESKRIRRLDGATALRFVRDLVVRFGIPHSIITDNGNNLSLREVEAYCWEKGIRLDLASVAHPQSNGQVERANGLILQGIKPRLHHYIEQLEPGRKNCHMCCGVYELHPTDPPATPLISWYMEQKPSYLPTYFTMHQESPSMTKMTLKNPDA